MIEKLWEELHMPKIVEFFKDTYNKLFNKQVELSAEGPLNQDMRIVANTTGFKFPIVTRAFNQNPEVALFSSYLKIQGSPQDLQFGDFYYVKEEGQTMVRMYRKVKKSPGDFDWDDYEFQSKSYIRMVTIEEAMQLIHTLGFDYIESGAIYLAPGNCSIGLINHTLKVTFVSSATNPHSMFLKAAYLCSASIKSIQEANEELAESDIIEHTSTDGEHLDDFDNNTEDDTESDDEE